MASETLTRRSSAFVLDWSSTACYGPCFPTPCSATRASTSTALIMLAVDMAPARGCSNATRTNCGTVLGLSVYCVRVHVVPSFYCRHTQAPLAPPGCTPCPAPLFPWPGCRMCPYSYNTTATLITVQLGNAPPLFLQSVHAQSPVHGCPRFLHEHFDTSHRRSAPSCTNRAPTSATATSQWEDTHPTCRGPPT